MNSGQQKCGLAELLALSHSEFDTQIKEMSLKDLLDTISTLQKEMSKEQENFNSLSAELPSLNKKSQQYKQISKEMTESQTRLTALMDRSMKCFQQQGNQSTSTKFPNVYRRNSLKETSKPEKLPVNKPVQRNMSARIPSKEMEITRSTPNLKTTTNKPVFLKTLTDVNASKLEVKKFNGIPNNTSEKKPIQVFQNGTVHANGQKGEHNLMDKKQPSVKSTATFNMQKSKSNEFLHNISSPRNEKEKSVFDSTNKPAPNFNVILRKTNRSLVDNEEQENNFRHSVDLDLRGSSKSPVISNKSAESETRKIPDVKVSSTQQQKADVKLAFDKKVATSVESLQKETLKQNQNNTTKTEAVKQVNEIQNLKQNNTTKKVEVKQSKETQNTTKNVEVKQGKVTQNTTKTLEIKQVKETQNTANNGEVKQVKETQNKPTVKSSIQFRPTTAIEAKAVSTGERQNLLQQIQNFKRKPQPEEEGKTVVNEQDGNTQVPDIIKSSIKKDVIDDRDLSPEEAHGVPLEDDEIAPHRINLINWDPTKLLNVLYTVKLEKDTTEDISHQFVNMEGLMEKLPMNKKKATLLKTWKRRFFRAKDGWLHYYETSNRDKPSDSVQLMGGKIDDLGNRVLGVDDGRGRFLMVRCPTEKEYGQWKLALESQTVNNVTYVRPVMSSPPHPEKKVMIIDIGSGGIRAGVMGAQPCLPQMFFPSVVAKHKTTQELVIGIDAYKPEIRKNSTLIKLVEPSNKVDKFAIDMEMMSAVFDYIFKGLKADSAKYWIMLSTPYKLGDAAMSSLMKILTDKFNVKGVCMVMQSLLALYSYNATSGIIVDIGERMEILPIFDGVLIEGGVSRQSYGGQKIADSLNSSLVEHKYNFVTPVDKLLVRYVMEQSCYACENYKDMKSKCDKDSDSYKSTVYLNNFDLPEDAHMSVTHDISCFKSAEGFFNTDLWGMDYPCVHKLIYQAIQSCPMDNRKHMYRAIYLSGGVTMLPGFSERLQAELKKLAPPSVLVEVHASPQRYYSAFIGAGTLLSNLAISEQIFISSEDWKKDGVATFRRWKAS
ncbi:Hypothetical predicted protein [Mytilus galloprovincialis]|nr:Hypothetical predicted protein [Mytilus galloprovincialis]